MSASIGKHLLPHGVYVIGEWDGISEIDGCPVMSAYIKVGISRDPTKRLAQLQTANPRTLLMLHWQLYPTLDRAREIEAIVHTKLAGGRITGEWFEATPTQAAQCMELHQ